MRSGKMILLILILFLFKTVCLEASAPEELFNKANEFYQKKNYSQAIENYMKIISTGYESADLYYNIGNAYYRLRDLPNSVYYFEKAKKLNPDDDEIDFNLKIANLRVIDKFEQVPRFFLFQWFDQVTNLFSAGRWAIISIITLWIGFALLCGFIIVWNIRLRKIFFASAILSFILCISSLFFAISRQNLDTSRVEAIIYSENTYVKSSPDDKSTDLFIIHEGTKVQVTDYVGSWSKIKLPNGSIGWILKDSYKII